MKRLMYLSISILCLSVSLWAYGDDSTTPLQAEPLTLDDLLGVWHCVLCMDPGSPTDTLRDDSTAFWTISPDSVMKLYCAGNLLTWFDFRSPSPDTMLIDARGPITNEVDVTLGWARIPGTSNWNVEGTGFGFTFLQEVRKKISQEPACPPADATPTTWSKLKSQYQEE